MDLLPLAVDFWGGVMIGVYVSVRLISAWGPSYVR